MIGQSKINVLSSAIARLPRYTLCKFSAFDLLRDYINASSVDGPLEIEILAVGCVKPQHGRPKICVRSRQTSLESVRSIDPRWDACIPRDGPEPEYIRVPVEPLI